MYRILELYSTHKFWDLDIVTYIKVFIQIYTDVFCKNIYFFIEYQTLNAYLSQTYSISQRCHNLHSLKLTGRIFIKYFMQASINSVMGHKGFEKGFYFQPIKKIIEQ